MSAFYEFASEHPVLTVILAMVACDSLVGVAKAVFVRGCP